MNSDFPVSKVFCSGINGAGMSGLACILLQAGVEVEGSDRERIALSQELEALGAAISYQQSAENVRSDHELFIHSAAIRAGHPEYDQAHALGIRCMKYAEMLGELTKLRKTVAIAGTHGKTSTSTLATTIFDHAGILPSWIIGGSPLGLKAPSCWQEGEHFVVEACEYDRSFHQLTPHYALLHNIEADHMDYYGTFDNLIEAFTVFAQSSTGAVVANLDDENVRSILPDLTQEILTYGRSNIADVQAREVRFCEGFMSFDLCYDYESERVTLGIPGRTALPNALAAAALAIAAGIDLETIAEGLGQAQTVKRRFEKLANHRGIEIYDDYAHHPTSVKELAASARSRFSGKELTFIFQAHQYARLVGFFDEFAEGLRSIDRVLICPTFAARESGVTPGEPEAELEAVLRSHGCEAHSLASLDAAVDFFDLKALSDQAIIVVGAGDVTRVGHQLADRLLALPERVDREAA